MKLIPAITLTATLALSASPVPVPFGDSNGCKGTATWDAVHGNWYMVCGGELLWRERLAPLHAAVGWCSGIELHLLRLLRRKPADTTVLLRCRGHEHRNTIWKRLVLRTGERHTANREHLCEAASLQCCLQDRQHDRDGGRLSGRVASSAALGPEHPSPRTWPARGLGHGLQRCRA